MVEYARDTRSNELETLAALFKLLSDGTRLRILSLLAKGERNVSSLCDELKLPQPTVSHHLGLLRMKNIIVNRRSGKQVFYGLDGHVNALADSGLEVRADGYTVRVSGPGI
ncbi:MAG TPA: metalloregulator ArsR/SmtB family transcription factor [Humisphaera sp.]